MKSMEDENSVNRFAQGSGNLNKMGSGLGNQNDPAMSGLSRGNRSNMSNPIGPGNRGGGGPGM